VQSFNLTIEKNVVDIMENGSLKPWSFINQPLRVSWDIEMVYRNNDFRDKDIAGTKESVEIIIEWDSLIGATEKAKLTIELPTATFDDWGRSDDNNTYVTQNFGFTWIHTTTDLIKASLQNTRATTY
jgi:hypothetical protein